MFVKKSVTNLHWLCYIHGPGQNIHGKEYIIDFAGPFLGSMFILVVDPHSKWLARDLSSQRYHYRKDFTVTVETFNHLWIT